VGEYSRTLVPWLPDATGSAAAETRAALKNDLLHELMTNLSRKTPVLFEPIVCLWAEPPQQGEIPSWRRNFDFEYGKSFIVPPFLALPDSPT